MMDIDEIADRMRDYERAEERFKPNGLWLVIRLDGRGFTRLTKEGDRFDKPFDRSFHDAMVSTSSHLMQCGFEMPIVFTQSDEISVLLRPDCEAFGRRVQKTTTVLAGEASAAFSVSTGEVGVFDARLLALPTLDDVVGYLVWRQEDATRNALSAHAYWALRRDGASAAEASSRLEGVGRSDKNELLFERGINFNTVPNWQKRGTLLSWENYEKRGYNPKLDSEVVAVRRRISVDESLPIKGEFAAIVRERVAGA